MSKVDKVPRGGWGTTLFTNKCLLQFCVIESYGVVLVLILCLFCPSLRTNLGFASNIRLRQYWGHVYFNNTDVEPTQGTGLYHLLVEPVAKFNGASFIRTVKK